MARLYGMIKHVADIARSEVTTLTRRDGDTPERLAARMVLLATAGRRVTVASSRDREFCQYLLAYRETDTGGVFWGRVDGRSIMGWNGHTVAAEILREFDLREIEAPSSRAA